MMGGRKRATAPVESVAVRCQNHERQIAEASKAIVDAMATAEKASSSAILQEARSKVEFSQLQRRRLIEERVALEVPRLEEEVEIAKGALERQNALGELVPRRKKLIDELTKVEGDIAAAEFDNRRLYEAIERARSPLAFLQSQRAVDQPQKTRLERELRERLDALA